MWNSGNKKIMGYSILIIVIVGFIIWKELNPSPEKALLKFQNSINLAEDQIIDPLIMCGNDVVPLVIQEIKDPNMPRRRYAILFLGNSGHNESIPSLRAILKDTNESEVIRGDALQAIANINMEQGRLLAKSYANNKGYIGEIAGDILSEDFTPIKRSYWDALLRRHN